MEKNLWRNLVLNKSPEHEKLYMVSKIWTRERAMSPKQRHNDLTDQKGRGSDGPIIILIIRRDGLIMIMMVMTD